MIIQWLFQLLIWRHFPSGERNHGCRVSVLTSLQRSAGLCWTSSVCLFRSHLHPAVGPGRATSVIPLACLSSLASDFFGWWEHWQQADGGPWAKMGSLFSISLISGPLPAGCFASPEATDPQNGLLHPTSQC